MDKNSSRLVARSLRGLTFLAAVVCLPLHAATVNVPADFPTIQAAVTAANPGDTIQVAAGTYSEQLVISKTLTISGAGSATTIIQAPNLIPDPTIVERTIVAVSGAITATISGFTIQGPGTSCSVAYGMVAYQGATLISNNNHVTLIGDSPIDGLQCGTAIRAGFPGPGGVVANLTVNNTQIDKYQKNGIRIDGAGSTASVTGSTITANGATTAIAQNGIVVSNGAAASITGNNVSGSDCDEVTCNSDPTLGDQSAGILLFSAGAVTMSGNTLTGNDTGITVVDTATAATSSNNTLTGNRYENIFVEAGTLNVQGGVIGPTSNFAIYALSRAGNARASVVQVQCLSTSLTGPQLANTVAGAQFTASITLQGCVPPAFAKVFGAPSIQVATGTTMLTFTLTNPNLATALTGVAFTDTLPSGLVVGAPNGLANTCGGTVTAAIASGSVALVAGGLAAGASCTITVTVTGTTVGTKNNVTGVVTSVEGGTGGTASASLIVAAGPPPVVAPTIAKVFGASSIGVNGSTTLTFTLTNPNATTALTGVAFADTLPSGLVVSTPNGLANTCGGTVTAAAASGSVVLAAGSLAAATSCTITVSVTGTTVGAKNNITGAVSSVEGGTGGTASASLTVAAVAPALPPTLVMGFGASSIPVNGSTTLTFTLTNPNATTALTGVGFTNTLASGLVLATPNGLMSTCSGTVTATAGSGSVSLAGATLAAGASCAITVNVTATSAGTKDNTTGPVSSAESGNGSTASAVLVVTGGPPPPPTAPIPTLQQWALWLLGLLILVSAGGTFRRRRSD